VAAGCATMRETGKDKDRGTVGGAEIAKRHAKTRAREGRRGLGEELATGPRARVDAGSSARANVMCNSGGHADVAEGAGYSSCRSSCALLFRHGCVVRPAAARAIALGLEGDILMR